MILLFFNLINCYEVLSRCDHDDIQKRIPDPFNDPLPDTPILLDAQEMQPLRIYFDLSNVKLTYLGEDSTKNKSSSAFIKASKLYNNLEITLQNLANFCSRLLKVKLYS